MKKIFFSLFLGSLCFVAVAQKKDSSGSSGFGGFLKKASEAVNSSKSTSGSSLTSDEIVAGLKEALSVGAQKSTGKLSMVDGFLKDAAVKILMPDEVKKLELNLRALGMGKLVDD